MQSSYWGYWLVVFGVAIVGLVITVNGITSTETQDYYTIKENVDASMLESIDFAYYRDYNEIKINKEKFMEVFIRKLPAVMAPNSTFKVNFYAIYEAPPKVSVEILSNSGASFIAGNYDTVTRIDAILQTFAKEITTANRPNTGNNSNNTGNNNTNFNQPGAGSNNNTGSGTNSGSSNNRPSTGTNTGTGSNNANNNTSSGNNNNNTGGNSSNNSGNNSSTNRPDTGTNNNTGNNTGTGTNTGTGSSTGSGSSGGNVVADTCRSGIADKTLAGKEGVAMHTRNIYDNVNVKSAKVTGTTTPGKKFKILGESADLWAIEYDGKCGWVASDYMAINAVGYLPNTQFNITNASSSIYKSSGVNIAGLTGKRLYSSEYNNSWVPITYSFAKKLKVAAENARRGGDTLVIMDAYRPQQVSQLANKQLTALYNSNNTVKSGIKSGSWDIGWFISQGVSTHNTACAVDITLSGKSMPTAMHELSTKAIKYKTPSLKTSLNYAPGMANSAGAKALHNYMMSVGDISDLASEWWHYQDNACHSRLKGSPSRFWSAV